MSKEWCERYSLNHPKIDAQHQRFFQLARSIRMLDENSCCKENVSRLLKEIFEHIREHFEEEENYMRSLIYPKLEMHQKEHEELIQYITVAVKESKSIIVLQKKMKEFSDLMVKHVIHSDVQIAKWHTMHTVNVEECEAI